MNQNSGGNLTIMVNIDAKALSEVYSIINIMDIRIVNRIPSNLIEFIRNNRDILYNPKFEKIPENFDNLEHDTKIFFALIYKKYFLKSDFTGNNLQLDNKDLINEGNVAFVKEQNSNLIIQKNTFIEKIIRFTRKIKKFFIK